MEAVYARKSSALAELADACRRKFVELIEAKAVRDGKVAAQTGSGCDPIVGFPSCPTARAIVLASRDEDQA